MESHGLALCGKRRRLDIELPGIIDRTVDRQRADVAAREFEWLHGESFGGHDQVAVSR
jgi:hypothetical protein